MLRLGQINKASLAAAEQWLCCVFAPQNSVLSPCRMKTWVSTPEPAPCCSVRPLWGLFGVFTLLSLLYSSSFSVPHILAHLWPRTALFCPPFLSPFVSWAYLVYVYKFFTGFSPSFCLMGTAFSTTLLLSFYASYIQIAQYITKYHPVTLSHTHLLLLLFEAADLCKQGG